MAWKSAARKLDTQEDAQRGLVAAYLAMDPPPAIIKLAREVGCGLVSRDVQVFFFEHGINSVVCKKYPLSQQYVRKVLKQMILTAESEDQEVLNELYEQYALSLTCLEKEVMLAEKCYKSYLYSLPSVAFSNLITYVGEKRASKLKNMIVTVRVSLNILEGSTGLCTWSAGLFLSEFLLTYPQIFIGKCCLELGSGTGLTSICLAQLNPSKVIVTDGNQATLANLKHNLLINGVSMLGEVDVPRIQNQSEMLTLVDCEELRWETTSQDELVNFGAHVIIGADLIYDPSCIPHIIRVLIGLLSTKKTIPKCEARQYGVNLATSVKMCQGGSSSDEISEGILGGGDERFPVAFLATPVRNSGTYNMFLSLACEAGILVKDVTRWMQPSVCLPVLHDYDRASIHLHRLSM